MHFLLYGWSNAEIQEQYLETALIKINVIYMFTPNDLLYTTYLVFYSEFTNEP